MVSEEPPLQTPGGSGPPEGGGQSGDSGAPEGGGQSGDSGPPEGSGQPASLTARAFELPGARQIVGRGFELAVRASSEIRRASLYFGGLLVALVAPPLLLALGVAATAPDMVQEVVERLAGPALASNPRAILGGSATSGGQLPADWLAASCLVFLAGTIALAGVLALSVDGQIAGITIMAGRHAGRMVTLRQALGRARQVFWPAVWASTLVAIPIQAAQLAVSAVLGAIGLGPEAAGLATTAVVTVLGAPFGYVAVSVVLGDVGPATAIRRSIALARARPRVALVVALFPAVFAGVQLFALAAGGDLLLRAGAALGLGFGTDAPHEALTIIVAFAAIAAAGSLVFTVSALLATPAVVAFLGLTYFEGGLDRALATDRRAGRWLSRPMTAGLGLGLVLVAAGLALLAGRL